MAASAVVRDALCVMRRPALSRRFSQAVNSSPHPVKVNVGAGAVRLEGWINTDVTWWSEMWLDLTRPWPVGTDRISHIYGDNVIEHFPLPVARTVLRNAYDGLAPGGIIRIATPDAEATARAYLHDPDLTRQHLERHRRKGYAAEYPADMLRITYAYHGHHAGYIFDWESLSAEMTRAGFTSLIRRQPNESNDDALCGLQNTLWSERSRYTADYRRP